MARTSVVLTNPLEKLFSAVTRYHYYIFFFIFACKLPVFWHILNLIFLSPHMDYYCNKSDAGSKNVCPCEKPSWDRSVFTETVQTKFGLHCETAWLISFSQSMLYAGTLIGALSFGFLSDKYGRLIMLSISCFILAVSGCLVSIMPNAPAFIFMRCIEGIGVGGAIVISYVLCVEYCGVNYRETVSALFHIPINLSHMSIAGVSYLLRNCDHFQLAISLPVFLFVPLPWLIMESPKWLMDNKKVDKAVLIAEKICKFNNVDATSIKEEIETYCVNHTSTQTKQMSFLEIFKHKRLTLNIACMSVIFFVCGMGYYGVSQYIGNMSGEIHVNVAISGTLLLPGTIASIFLLKKLKRRPFLMATNFLSGLFMIVVVCIPLRLAWLRVFFACICNCFFFMSFIIVFLFGVELFPTSVRNSVLGFLSVLSRLGQIVAPPINSLPQLVSGIIFSVMAICGGCLCYLLPETKDTELPSTLDDSRSLYKRPNQNSNGGKQNTIASA